ncbi:hypothetical protein F2Q69_00055229 [Brassica cretica]|uniref:Uncharacterized protein n=1 Tax=Brassica cretica TaxID=69181 RepID=A0A8S9N3Z8_BRACR|nr:hypothetical protein F2Q69_00055229 [Brassica cretica]
MRVLCDGSKRNRDLLSQFGDSVVNPLHPLSTLLLSIKITGKSNQNLTMWGSRPSMQRMEISRRVVGGTPSSSSWRRVVFCLKTCNLNP